MFLSILFINHLNSINKKKLQNLRLRWSVNTKINKRCCVWIFGCRQRTKCKQSFEKIKKYIYIYKYPNLKIEYITLVELFIRMISRTFHPPLPYQYGSSDHYSSFNGLIWPAQDYCPRRCVLTAGFSLTNRKQVKLMLTRIHEGRKTSSYKQVF